MDIKINVSDAITIFQWLMFKAHEVNIQQKDIDLIEKIKPLLFQYDVINFTYQIDELHRRFKEQQS
jgi:hypothetical protein